VSWLFVDTSALVAVAFRESGHRWLAEHLAAAQDLFAAPLLEAEFRATLAREEVEGGIELLGAFRWVLPDRPLSPELDRVFGAGHARGADAWHLASALFLVESPGDLPFLTLDRRQRDIARSLGFPTPHPQGA
jgi:predicted nucleic acid-binding protein